MEKYDIVIIGGGPAGVTVAEQIRKENKNVSVCILSQEKVLPYYRLKLGYYLQNPIDEKFFLKSSDWYKANNIRLMLNSRVKECNFEEKVVFSETKKIHWDFLVIASGSKPYLPEHLLMKRHKTLCSLSETIMICFCSKKGYHRSTKL